VPRGSAASVPRPSEWFLGAAYCVAGRRGGVFAHAGTMSSSLLLPEQLASSAPKIATTRIRIMTGGFPEDAALLLLKAGVSCLAMSVQHQDRTFSHAII
jgi:hypothetical protein